MKRFLAAFLLLPGLALAQNLPQSGPNAPAASSQIPPTTLPNEGGDRSGANAPPGGAAGNPNLQGTDHIRTAPPRDHQVLGGPAVPGATQPQSSEGAGTSRDRIPARPGARPDASTTGR